MRQHEFMDSALFLHMIRAGHRELNRRKEEVNALNVFPVPDGDTGTNMYLSFTAGIGQLARLSHDANLDQLTHAFSSGLLLGARGNSGVILSQLFRGFQMAFSGAEQVTPRLLAASLSAGVRTAYKAVSRPVEGTILTVAREAAAGAENAAKKKDATLHSVLEAAVVRGEQALLRT